MVIPCVLLEGRVDHDQCLEAMNEIMRIADRGAERIHLIVSCPNGGSTDAALEFVENIRGLGISERLSIKIYEAVSAAAYIAMSIGSYREMKKGSLLRLHSGRTVIEAALLDHEFNIPEFVRSQARRFHSAFFEEIAKFAIPEDPKLLAELRGGGWLHLSAEECLRLSIVHSLF